jgi:hypothetical protein
MNAHAERFNRTIQESFVDYHEELLFTDLALFNRKLADWLVFYNAERPHHTLGQRSPLSFLLQHQPECQRYWTHTRTCISRAVLRYHVRGHIRACALIECDNTAARGISTRKLGRRLLASCRWV